VTDRPEWRTLSSDDRRVVAEFGDTPQPRAAAGRIRALVHMAKKPSDGGKDDGKDKGDKEGQKRLDYGKEKDPSQDDNKKIVRRSRDDDREKR